MKGEQNTQSLAILTGDTYEFRGRLKADGWRWDPSRKAWTKIGEWTDSDHVLRSVRSIGGIRNRGDFSAMVDRSKAKG